MKTSQYLAAYRSQNVRDKTSGYSFGVIGTLTNTGNTLDVGAGTNLGQLGLGTFIGGTIIDHGSVLGGDDDGRPTLENLTLEQTASSTYTLDSSVLTNVILTGASTIDCDDSGGFTQITGGTLSGVGTLNLAAVDLNGVDITGVGDSGHVQVNLVDGETFPVAALEIGAQQSVVGYTFAVMSTETTIALDGGVRLDDAVISVAAGLSADIDVSTGASQSVIIGSASTIGFPRAAPCPLVQVMRRRCLIGGASPTPDSSTSAAHSTTRVSLWEVPTISADRSIIPARSLSVKAARCRCSG